MAARPGRRALAANDHCQWQPHPHDRPAFLGWLFGGCLPSLDGGAGRTYSLRPAGGLPDDRRERARQMGDGFQQDGGERDRWVHAATWLRMTASYHPINGHCGNERGRIGGLSFWGPATISPKVMVENCRPGRIRRRPFVILLGPWPPPDPAEDPAALASGFSHVVRRE